MLKLDAALTVPAALRFIKACLRTGNHFIHRSFMKNGVTKAVLDLVERETTRDTMLSSACLDTLELIRKVRGPSGQGVGALTIRTTPRPSSWTCLTSMRLCSPG